MCGLLAIEIFFAVLALQYVYYGLGPVVKLWCHTVDCADGTPQANIIHVFKSFARLTSHESFNPDQSLVCNVYSCSYVYNVYVVDHILLQAKSSCN